MARKFLEIPPKYAVISASTNGNNTLVAAVTGKKIRVLACVIMSAGTINATFQSGAGGTALSGAFPLTAQAGMVLPLCEVGWFETAAGSLLNLSLSAGVLAAGVLVYQEIF